MIGSNSKFKKTWIERCRHLCVCPLIDHRREPTRMRELLILYKENYLYYIKRNWLKEEKILAGICFLWVVIFVQWRILPPSEFFRDCYCLVLRIGSCTVYCLLITLTCSPKAELRRAQLNGIGWMHVKGASGSRQTAMTDPGAQQPSQMFLTWVKARPQHRELRALLFTNSVWVL